MVRNKNINIPIQVAINEIIDFCGLKNIMGLPAEIASSLRPAGSAPRNDK